MKPVIVVEGTSDVNKLQNLVDADFVITNGSVVSRETINYLKKLSLKRKIILRSASADFAGNNLLCHLAPNALHSVVHGLERFPRHLGNLAVGKAV